MVSIFQFNIQRVLSNGLILLRNGQKELAPAHDERQAAIKPAIDLVSVSKLVVKFKPNTFTGSYSTPISSLSISVHMQIIRAQTSNHLDQIRTLFREYEQFLNVDLCFQGFEEELAGLPGKYAPPDGALFLALKDQETAGCVAVRPLEAGICEMKRLYIRPSCRGLGLGKKLAETIISEAENLKYRLMRLDTLETLTEAMGLYHSMGFSRTSAYYHNPLQDVIYWERPLGSRVQVTQIS